MFEKITVLPKNQSDYNYVIKFNTVNVIIILIN